MEIMGTRSEYNATSKEHSGVILMGLAALIQVLGVLLAIALPWSFLDFMAGEQLLNANPMYQIFFAFLGILSFLLIGRWCIVSLFALRANRQRRQNVELPLSGWPSVSILVPAYQEAENIESALRSLVELDYPNFEIIVVDDGSSDDTFAKAQKFEGRFSRGTVRVLRKRNGGKWSALNFAFQVSIRRVPPCVM